ncbi:MAG: diguanylate cyclase [Gemmatimonadota bacterium]
MTERSSGMDEALQGHILLVDDNLDNLDIVSTRLEFLGYRVDTVATGDGALAQFRKDTPDLVLLDVMLPGIDGYEVARRIRADEQVPYVPIILVTARDSTRDKVTGLDAGADDYLTKPINFPELEARVRSMLRIKKLQDQLEASNRKLEHLSISDGLTGLYNHRHIHEVLVREFDRSMRTHEPISVAMFDLDRFKSVNDRYGHQAGDSVLRAVSDILRETAREVDVLGRYGGEEFIAVLPGTELHDAAVFAERVRAAVAGATFPLDGQPSISMTISGGIASWPARNVTDARTLIEAADRALYAAKEGGRDRIVRASEVVGPAPLGA